MVRESLPEVVRLSQHLNEVRVQTGSIHEEHLSCRAKALRQRHGEEGREQVGGLGARAHKDLVVNVNSECNAQDSL